MKSVKSLKVFLVSCLMFAFMFNSVAFGAPITQESLNEVEEVKVAETIQIGTAKVNVYEDGRVGKILKPSSLSKTQKQEILSLMNFSDEEISRFSDPFINELLKDGGVRVDIVVEDYIHTYTDASGVEQTVSVAEKIDGRDFNIASNDGAGPVEEGTFYGNGYLTYLGSDSTNYKYKYRTYFSFDSKPFYTYTDTVAHSWQSHTTSTSVTGKYHYRRGPNSGWLPGNMELDVSSGYGTEGAANIVNNTGFHEGWIDESVAIPKNLKGQKGQWASSYAHQHSPSWLDGVGISIGGYLTINFTGTFGDKWSWRNTFTIGDTALD